MKRVSYAETLQIKKKKINKTRGFEIGCGAGAGKRRCSRGDVNFWRERIIVYFWAHLVWMLSVILLHLILIDWQTKGAHTQWCGCESVTCDASKRRFLFDVALESQLNTFFGLIICWFDELYDYTNQSFITTNFAFTKLVFH